MKSYLLLRDNKQSGPHSYEEILQLGLLAYDLIWVDGKSAAWRYPGELPEFKEWAPPVAEQPFDRFFRKPDGTGPTHAPQKELVENGDGSANFPVVPNSEDSPHDPDIPTLARFMQEQVAEQEKLKQGSVMSVPQSSAKGDDPGTSLSAPVEPRGFRFVSVQLPSQDASQPWVVISKPGSQAPAIPASPTKVPASSESVPEEGLRPGHQTAILFPERDATAVLPKAKAVRGYSPVLQYAAIAVGILSFIGLGVLIGVKWSNYSSRHASSLQEDRVPAGSTSASGGGTGLAQPIQDLTHSTDSSRTVAATVQEQKTIRKPKKDSNSGNIPVNDGLKVPDPGKEPDSSRLQEEDRKRKEWEEKERVRNNIVKMVGLEAGPYKVGLFGGISDMKVSVNNQTGYSIDLVVVEVNYLLSNKSLFKTETLRFRDLSPHGSQTLELPKTGRGIKVESRIIQISSRELGLD